MKHLLTQIKELDTNAAANGNGALASPGEGESISSNLQDFYLNQLREQKARAAAQQLGAVRAVKQEIEVEAKMRHWAVTNIALLAQAINFRTIQPEQWETLETHLLPVTKELFAEVDERVALELQQAAVIQILSQNSSPSSTGYVDPGAIALPGVQPTALLIG